MILPRFQFPGGARFAFTILDDTDVATVENVLPIYRLLESLGMRTTKTVWPLRCEEGSEDFCISETMDDPHYCDFVVDLHRRRFEIAFHCATMESSARERTERALRRFRLAFGGPPRVHANHGVNRENLYWGVERIDEPVLRLAYRLALHNRRDVFQGHRPDSPYWWGDLCREQIDYVRNLTFSEINLLRLNPSMPYRDPARPCVHWWFSASEAEDAAEFHHLLRLENQERLEAEGGVSIVYTHFGKGYCYNGRVEPATQRLLERLGQRPGWFVPVAELLDWLRAQHTSDELPRREWRWMQWRWAWDVLVRRASAWRHARDHGHEPDTGGPATPRAMSEVKGSH